LYFYQFFRATITITVSKVFKRGSKIHSNEMRECDNTIPRTPGPPPAPLDNDVNAVRALSGVYQTVSNL